MSNQISRKAYQYRLYPTAAQAKTLLVQLEACRTLYNAALTERREAYRMQHKSISYFDQAAQLKDIRTFDTDLVMVNFSATQEVLRRLDKAFKAFFERIKNGQKPGYPRYKGFGRYASITYPTYGDGGKIRASGKLYLQNIGIIKFKQHRNLMGNIKTVTIRKSGQAWFVSFSCQYEFEVAPHKGKAIGLDVGIEFYASLSNGEQIANPRHFRASEKRLAKSQRKLARLKTLPKTDPKKRKAKKAVALAHTKIRNQRGDFQHKTTGKLAVAFSLICVEALQITNLTKCPKPKQAEDGSYLPNGASAKSGLAKSINDAGWDTFISILTYKAVEAGGQVLKVNPKYTSQICPQCGNQRKKELSQRWHSCECGCELPRDVAAAKNILAVGLHSLGSNPLEAVLL